MYISDDLNFDTGTGIINFLEKTEHELFFSNKTNKAVHSRGPYIIF